MREGLDELASCGVGDSDLNNTALDSSGDDKSPSNVAGNESDSAGNGVEPAAEEPDAVPPQMEEVSGMLKDAADTMERNTTYRQTLIGELKDGKHKEIIEEMVKQMGGKLARSYDANRKKALLWLEAAPASRPFLFLTVAELKVHMYKLIDCFYDSYVSNLRHSSCLIFLSRE